jgi:hypothetical protein
LELRSARATLASHLSPETTRLFDIALHDAAASSIESMLDLREAVCDCVEVLRNADVGPVQMILAMKACAIDSRGRYNPEGDEYTVSNVDLLLEQIVKWAIIEYYRTVS